MSLNLNAMKTIKLITKTETKTNTAAVVSIVFGLMAAGGIGFFLLFKTPFMTDLGDQLGGSAATTWQNINPGGGGEFTSIGAGPTGIIIAGSDLSGAYRSKDRGLTWDVIGSYRGLKVAHVSTVAFDPLNSTIIYLGTEAGIYRSNDSGETFGQVTTTGYIGAIAPARSNTSIIYAGVHSLYNATDTTIYKSTDQGLTWTAVGLNLPAGLRVLKLMTDPKNPSIVYLVSGWDRFVPTAQMAVYKSIDGGVTWARIASSVGDVWDFAMDQVNTQNLYLTTYIPACTTDCPPAPCTPTSTSSWRGCVFKSTDGGQTWTRVAERTGVIFVKRDQPQVIRTIDIQRDVASSRAGVWESVDGGVTWTQKSLATSWDGGWQNLNWAYGRNLQGMPKTLGLDLSNPNVMLLADSQFVFAAFDGTKFSNIFTNQTAPGWWRSRGVDNVAVLSLAQSEATPTHVYAGFYDLGLWRSLDGGDSWQSANNVTFTGNWFGNGGNTTTVVADPTRADVVWATMGDSNDLTNLVLVKSTSGGVPTSWTATAGLPTGFISGLSLSRTSPSTSRTLFVTANGDVYRSQDDGANWSLVFACQLCRTTNVDRNNGQLVYAGGEGGLWRSTSGGSSGSWTVIGTADMSGLNTKPLADVKWPGVHHIIPDPQQSGKVYVVSYGSNHGLYRSLDQGTTWTKLRTCTYCRDLALDSTNPNVMYLTASRAYKDGGKAAGSEGIQRSTDGGMTWVDWNGNLAWPFVGPVIVDAANSNQVFVGAPGIGFFRRFVQ